jgi:hypothetical protein
MTQVWQARAIELAHQSRHAFVIWKRVFKRTRTWNSKNFQLL